MAKLKYKKRISNSVVKEEQKVADDTKDINVKPKSNSKTEYGSGNEEKQRNGGVTLKNRKFPEIKSVERNVLQSIIGQDKQVRQIITAIYRAINFKTIKSNVLIIGSSGTGKTETIRQIVKRLHIPYEVF